MRYTTLHGLASDYAEQATKRDISEGKVTDFGSSTFDCVKWRRKADHQPPDERIQEQRSLQNPFLFLNDIANCGAVPPIFRDMLGDFVMGALRPRFWNLDVGLEF